MKDMCCSGCLYFKTTNDFMMGYCTYWGKIVFMTDGCSLDSDDEDFDILNDNDF